MRESLVLAHIQLALACIAKQITFNEFRSVTSQLENIMTREEIATARYQAEAVRTTIK